MLHSYSPSPTTENPELLAASVTSASTYSRFDREQSGIRSPLSATSELIADLTGANNPVYSATELTPLIAPAEQRVGISSTHSEMSFTDAEATESEADDTSVSSFDSEKTTHRRPSRTGRYYPRSSVMYRISRSLTAVAVPAMRPDASIILHRHRPPVSGPSGIAQAATVKDKDNRPATPHGEYTGPDSASQADCVDNAGLLEENPKNDEQMSATKPGDWKSGESLGARLFTCTGRQADR
jgi:hypothetical protein